MLAATGCDEKIIPAPSITTAPSGDQRQSPDEKDTVTAGKGDRTDDKTTGSDNQVVTDAKQDIATDVPIKKESTTKPTKSETQQHLDILVEAKQHDGSKKNPALDQHSFGIGVVPGTAIFENRTSAERTTQIGTPEGVMIVQPTKELDGSSTINCAKWDGTSWSTIGPSNADDGIALKNGSQQLLAKTQRSLTPRQGRTLNTPIISTGGWSSRPNTFLHLKQDQQVTMLELSGQQETIKSLNAEGEIERKTTAQYVAAALWTEGPAGFSSGDISRMEDVPGIASLGGVDYDYEIVNDAVSVVWDSTDRPIVVLLEQLDTMYLDTIPDALPIQRLRTFRLELTDNTWTELPVVNIFHNKDPESPYSSSWNIKTRPIVMLSDDDQPLVAWIEGTSGEQNGYIISLSIRMKQWTGSEWQEFTPPPSSQGLFETVSQDIDNLQFVGQGRGGDGNLWLAWVDRDKAIYVSRWDGQAWHTMSPIYNAMSDRDELPKLTVSADGQVHVAEAFFRGGDPWMIRVFQLGEDDAWQVLLQEKYYGSDAYIMRRGTSFELTHTLDGRPVVFFTEKLGIQTVGGSYKTVARIWDDATWQDMPEENKEHRYTLAYWQDSVVARYGSQMLGISPNPVAISSSGSPTVLVPGTEIYIDSVDDWNRKWVTIYQDRKFDADYPHDWAQLRTPHPPQAFTGKLTDPAIRYGYDDVLYLSGSAVPTSTSFTSHPVTHWWQYIPPKEKGRGTWEALPDPVSAVEKKHPLYVQYGKDLSTTAGTPIASWFLYDSDKKTKTLMIKQWNGSSWMTIAGDNTDDVISGVDSSRSFPKNLEIHRPRAGELYVTWQGYKQPDSSDKSTKLRRWDPDTGLGPTETLDDYRIVRVTVDSTGRAYFMGLTAVRSPYYSRYSHYRITLLSRAKGETEWTTVAGGPDATDDGLVLEYARNIRLNTTADDRLLLTYTSTESNNRIGVAKLWDGETFVDYDIPGVDPEHTPDAHRDILRLNQSVRSDIGRSCFSWQQHTATRELLTAEFNINCIDL